MHTTTPTRVARGRVVRPEDAAARHWPLVIVGGGPAAAACGIAATAGGLDVLIIERSRMPRTKLCGCCLSPRSLKELDRMGFALSGDSAGVPLSQFRLVTPRGEARIPLAGPQAVSRDRLDSALLGVAVEQGCHLLPETAVQTAACRAEAAELTCRIGPDAATSETPAVDAEAVALRQSATVTLSAECVVLATGLSDTVRLCGLDTTASTAPPAPPAGRIGLGATLPPNAASLPSGELVMAVEPFGYCGAVVLEDGRIDIAAAVDADALASSTPADLLQTLLARTNVGSLPLATARLRGTPPLTHRRHRVQGRVFRAGDTAGYVEPFTGEGIGWALTSGRLAGSALAACLANGRIDHVAAARDYQRRCTAELGGSFRRCSLIARAVRSPRLMQAVLGGLRLAPWAGGPLVRLATGSGS